MTARLFSRSFCLCLFSPRSSRRPATLRALAQASLALALLVLASLTAAPARAFDAPTWEKVTRSTGTTFFYCRAKSCAGSLVSYHEQPGGAFSSLDGYTRHQAERFAALSSAGIDASRLALRETKVGRYRHFQSISRYVTRETGSAEFYVSGALVGSSVSYTLVSSNPDRATAEKNYRELLNLVRGLMTGPSIRI